MNQSRYRAASGTDSFQAWKERVNSSLPATVSIAHYPSAHSGSQQDTYKPVMVVVVPPSPPSPNPIQKPPTNNTEYIESFFGFCREKLDAQILIEAVIAGQIKPVLDLPPGCTTPNVRSGSVIVFQEGATQTLRVRWRDSKQWSSSKVSNQFLLYREVVASNQPLPQSTRHTERKTSFYYATSVRPNTKLVPGGLAKRAISLVGSNGAKFRVISYFYPVDVEGSDGRNEERGVLDIPSEMPEFREILSGLMGGDSRNDGAFVVRALPPKQRNSPLARENKTNASKNLSTQVQELELSVLGVKVADTNGSRNCKCGGLSGRTPFDDYRWNDERVWRGESLRLAPINKF
ncbi:UNVERIFIED_CONTAM: hypothetical protein HDU68_010277 [Siphonaria sp. JEL0065]|nr:hypothetical protein HDU68_010277 [Siphonaria sp. JEL0065]